MERIKNNPHYWHPTTCDEQCETLTAVDPRTPAGSGKVCECYRKE